MKTSVGCNRSILASFLASIQAFILVLLVLAAGGLRVTAQTTPQRIHIHLDPAATEIHYTLKDTLHTVKGTFRLKSGDISINAQTGEAQGMITVDVETGVSGNETRDNRMKRDFLETAKFPVATFEPQKVTGFSAMAASQTISVEGNLTLHGGSHPMALQFTVALDGPRTTTITSIKIPYVDWGIKNPSLPFIHVEKEVTIDISAKGTLEPK